MRESMSDVEILESETGTVILRRALPARLS
jgi:hypothetical protein